jgi:aspartate aminotransferase
LRDGRVSTVQTPGGSGGLCVAAHLILRANPEARVWLSDPSWPNHSPLLKLAGLSLEQYPYYDYENHCIDFDAMFGAFEGLDRGELVLLHGCCHNPSGADLSREQWNALAEQFERRGIVPFIDLAYIGLSEGLEEDAYGVRVMAERLPEVVVVASCSKNLGLYRERVGSASVVSKDPAAAKITLSNASNVARGIYSMPPDHGAAIVAEVLHDDTSRALWFEELGVMRDRLNDLRHLLVDKLVERNAPRDFSFIAQERGMFSFLGISREQVIRLREEFHVYMVESSRINIAGVNQSNAETVADAIVAVL